MSVGIEALNAYLGCASIDVPELFVHRGLDTRRLHNLMMLRRSVCLPFEDAVTNAVNAAQPLLSVLTPAERSSISLLITATESGLDFGKSVSSYIHHHLELETDCRYFEVKQACYGGTAALQMAAAAIARDPSPEARALVIATDVSRPQANASYAEPSQGTGAVALLVSRTPRILRLDEGANGYCSYEVMDAFRPTADIETGDPDLSLITYMDCLQRSYTSYHSKRGESDFRDFPYVAFHTPYAGMVASCHRNLLRLLYGLRPDEAERDFIRRAKPSVLYAMQVGNTYSASLYLALASLLVHATIEAPTRIGLFSYGSGCSSEFFSGMVTGESAEAIRGLALDQEIEARHPLTMTEYEEVNHRCREVRATAENVDVPAEDYVRLFKARRTGAARLRLSRVRKFHREYTWT
jgi:polyketide biosynthesis 3-hydroxy-3-methylglutaryl-CoA synthase-like enzyme PksG